MKSKISLSFLLLISTFFQALACEMCESQQPKILKGVAHGAGPEGNWDYLIAIIASVIVLFTLVLSIKYLVRPGEKDPNHIKNSILNQNSEL